MKNREIPKLYDLAFNQLVKHSLFNIEICSETTLEHQEGLHRLVEDIIIKKFLPELLQHIAYGEQNQAEEMLKVNPELLRYRGTTTDYSGRIIENVTAFQIALRMQDVEMWKMMEPYFIKLEDGQEERARQFNEEFPEGQPIEQLPYDFSQLVEIIAQSSNEDIKAAFEEQENDTPLCKALKEFRETFKVLSMQEKHFNLQHVIKASTIYNQLMDNMDWGLARCDLFWRKVIGYVERYFPACYAQAVSQGFYYVVEGKKPLQRTFDFSYGGRSFYPLLFDSPTGLGFSFAAAVSWLGTARSNNGLVQFDFLVNYAKQKHQSWIELCNECSKTQYRRFVV